MIEISQKRFQSLIGIKLNCNCYLYVIHEYLLRRFQSLIGIKLNCNSGMLKAYIYVVFKVQLRGCSYDNPFQKKCQGVK